MKQSCVGYKIAGKKGWGGGSGGEMSLFHLRITLRLRVLGRLNNNVHLSCAHQRPERSHNTY